MKKLIVGIIVVAGVSLALAAEKKDLKKVDTEALTNETQKSAEPSEGINIVWWVPTEFWAASLGQSKDVSAADADKIITAIEKYLIVAVVRADISPLGGFKFHSQNVVSRNLKAAYKDKEGKETLLVLETDLDEDTRVLLDVIKPILKNAMGRMGENFHFFVYRGTDAKGRRIVSPYEKGCLTVEMKKVSNEAGGKVEFNCPLNSLFLPRTCAGCTKQAHISWNFCPWCGKKLPE
ncbi:MAG: zinc ribbon domain-containing protein [Planctomycetaceae bacterium]|nr:zinc ribbon domain-containing protein [Planctomycetaceae bacterium]